MSECESCGREDGHYLGCPETAKPQVGETDLRKTGPSSLSASAESDPCAFDGCTNPRRPKGKGPAPRYCEVHSDPKNRK